MDASSHSSALVYATDSGGTSDHTDGVLPTYTSAPSSLDYAIGESEAQLSAYSSPTLATSGSRSNEAKPVLYTSFQAPPQTPETPTLMNNSSSPPSANSEDSQSTDSTALVYSVDAPVGSLVDPEATFQASTSKVHPASLTRRLSKRILSSFRFHSVEEAPKADAVIKRCRATVQSSAEFWSGARRDHIRLNRHQCDFLLRTVKAADSTLAAIQQSPLLSDIGTVPVLQELHQFLHDADTLIRRSYVTVSTNSELLRAATEQGDLKETFSHLLYDIQWCTSLLQCILLENSKESPVTFDPTSCECRLSASDELELLTAAKKDEKELRDHLRGIVKQLDVGKLAGKVATKLLAKLETYSPDPVFLNHEDLNLEGIQIGEGAFGAVRKIKFLSDRETCAAKTISNHSLSAEKEIDAIRKLGNHPHIVRLFCYSKMDLSEPETDPEPDLETEMETEMAETKVYLVMELLEKDLQEAIGLRRNHRLERALRLRGTQLLVSLGELVEPVSLMLKIGEGIKYMHGKGVAHRDLKPGNVLVNFEKFEGSSRIRSVKIADFGSTKAAERTETNTMNTGTTRYMAPEVMKVKGDPEKARLNLLKADVYSFAMMCIHILTGKYPLKFSFEELKKRIKAGERPLLRDELPNCPLRLATLLTKCWSRVPHERPSFPEICRELRYIKGLLLKGDEQKMQTQPRGPQKPLEGVKVQGPWGSPTNGREFFDMATSITGIELRYSEGVGPVGLFKVTYELLGKTFTRESYVKNASHGQILEKIKFQPEIEYIKQITGFVSRVEVMIEETKRKIIEIVSSLTFYTNLKKYGPFGVETGTKFTSDIGLRVIGFHGRAGNMLDSLGIITVPDV
ncbi:hypothetical protein M758_7G104200 [Ceratodon purpureus]|uniref:Protein kinase domain-containing protein n=1 Tax=Ceratodon purpureus TaxID=3225 RepID=A0A8T0H9T7_CERPU|nr:hypothetical protein KC19_7G110700 [Ceratodon purpureus]KAG0610961.1 hypothetical protein M758_7G104200 [Ceratodon purpureus]